MAEVATVPLTLPGQAETEQPRTPRVYVADSQSWKIAGGLSGSDGSADGEFNGGSSPQTVELIKTFGQRCPQVVVTNDRKHADYVVLFDRESFKSIWRKRDKIALFRPNGDVLFTDSVRSVGNAVKNACGAIEKDARGGDTHRSFLPGHPPRTPSSSTIAGDAASPGEARLSDFENFQFSKPVKFAWLLVLAGLLAAAARP